MTSEKQNFRIEDKRRSYSGSAFGFYFALLISFCFLTLTATGQNKTPSNPGSVRLLNNMDSAYVRHLFFSALREKTIDNLTLAAELFNKVILTDPDNDASLFELASIKKNQNKFDEAQPLLEKATNVNPNNEWYWASLAECYEKNNEVGKLENVFTQLTRINPDKTDYYFDKANAYYLDGKYDEALAVYDQVEKQVGPSDNLLADRQKIYLKQNKVDLAAQQMEQQIAAHPGMLKYYLFLAQLYTANNLGDKAFKVLLSAERMNAGDGLIHLALADAYRDKKDYERSYYELTLAFAIPEVDIDQKIKIIMGYLPKFPDPNAKASALELSKILVTAHPVDSRAYAVYGDMLLQNTKLRDAKEMYKKSIALNSQIYAVQEQLVRIELGDNDTEGAIKDGENSLSLFPNQAWMNYLVGVAYSIKKDSKKAISYIKTATELNLQDRELLSQSYAVLGDCYHDTHEFKNSDEAYGKALGYNPDNSYTLNNYAYYLSLRGEQLEKAAQMSKHSIDLQPNNASFEDTYAWILFKQKDYAGAKTWMEKALVDDKGGSAGKLEHYGDILFYLNDINGAVDNWTKAKSNGDKSPLLDRKINEKKYIE